MPDPTVTILLSSFNHEKFLVESIDSVVNQTYKDFQLIIKDDASTDSSWDIIKRYSDPRIIALRNRVNREKNFIDYYPQIPGTYVAIHHSDDVWELNKLEKQVAFLENHPDVGAVFSNATFIDENSRPIGENDYFDVHLFDQPNRDRFAWLNHFFYHGNALCHPSVLIRNECYQKCGYYRHSMVQLPDFDKWVRLCLKYEIHVLPEKLVNFRVLSNNANASSRTLTNQIRINFEYLQVYRNYLALTERDELARVLPAISRYEVADYFDHRYLLARAALDKENDPVCWLFGLQILFDLLNNPGERANLKKHYGFDTNTLSQLSASHDVFREEAHQQLPHLKNEIDFYRQSKSWKVTKPLRTLSNLIKKN